ncbi:MAG TPA: biotin--[acetyl-CoA-carboxylase] ligase, partial [Jatrophihabitantaceae bacterium]|nr:biotin--[acetyl-CoA-carboxylase] ligase [Jatrophihabitantaceae bacterium]
MPGREPLDESGLRDLLGTRWQRVVVVDETTSTNADLLQDTSAPDRSVLVAEVQTAGRGRLDRTWTSPPGAGLTFSVLLRPDVPMQHWGWLPLIAGVALHEAVASSTAVPVALKWPNDLLAGAESRKAAGILAQTSGD